MYISRSIRKKQEAIAKEIVTKMKVVYSDDPHEYRMIVPADFERVDHGFYARSLQWFLARGFRFMGDYENLTISRIQPKQRTFTRCILSDDGTIAGGIFHFKGGTQKFPKHHKIVQLVTELSDGTFVVTDSFKNNRALPVPGIEMVRFPQSIGLEDLLKAHHERIEVALDSRPKAIAMEMQTMEDISDSEKRMHEINAKYKKAAGYFRKEDFEAIKGRKLNFLEQGIVEALDKLKQDQTEG